MWRATPIRQKGRAKLLHFTCAGYQKAHLAIIVERGTREIFRADKRDALVDDEELGVHIVLRPGFDLEVGNTAEPGERRAAIRYEGAAGVLGRQHQLNLDTPFCRGCEGGFDAPAPHPMAGRPLPRSAPRCCGS